MRCPFRVAALDHPDECDSACAWLIDDACSNDSPRRVCAVTAIAEALGELSGVVMMGKNACSPTVWSAVNDRRCE